MSKSGWNKFWSKKMEGWTSCQEI